MGFSGDTFYRYRDAVEEGGVDALIDKSKRVPNLKIRMDVRTEEEVVKISFEYPAWGHERVANEMRLRGLSISLSGVMCVLLRNNLGNINKRLKALEERVAKEGYILTESHDYQLYLAINDHEK